MDKSERFRCVKLDSPNDLKVDGPKSSKWTVSNKIVDDRKSRNKSSWIEMDGSKKQNDGEIKIVLMHLGLASVHLELGSN